MNQGALYMEIINVIIGTILGLSVFVTWAWFAHGRHTMKNKKK